MDLTSKSAVEVNQNGAISEQQQAYVSMVDPFLVEALQNPRHRLTILRMELDIQKFMQNSNILQFEFPHFPTSYLRLAAHRVAQHYGLQTMVNDNTLDGQGIHILVIKKPETKFPPICLSDIPAVKDSENDKIDKVKFVLKPRPKASSNDANEMGRKRNQMRSVEQRKEDYDKARARIFSSPSGFDTENALARVSSVDRNLNVDENENEIVGSSYRVAIFRDKEKDRVDPDYDRSYDRYVKSNPSAQIFSGAHFSTQNFQPQFVQYDSVFPGQVPAPQASLNYRSHVMSPYGAMGLNQTSVDVFYVQWPTQSMMYARSYDQLRHAVTFQAPVCQQPLSFDYSHNHL